MHAAANENTDSLYCYDAIAQAIAASTHLYQGQTPKSDGQVVSDQRFVSAACPGRRLGIRKSELNYSSGQGAKGQPG